MGKVERSPLRVVELLRCKIKASSLPEPLVIIALILAEVQVPEWITVTAQRKLPIEIKEELFPGGDGSESFSRRGVRVVR
jgi:hypothetical protein